MVHAQCGDGQGRTDRADGDVQGGSPLTYNSLVFPIDLKEESACLAEEECVRAQIAFECSEIHAHADRAAEFALRKRHLEEREEEPAIRNIVAGTEGPVIRECRHQFDLARYLRRIR